MSQTFQAGDFLVYQLESSYGLLRVLAVDFEDSDPIWHIAAYSEFFLEVDQAEMMIKDAGLTKPSNPHIALTNRAFESTQVAKIAHVPLVEADLSALNEWRNGSDREISDRSVRLLLGLR